MSDPYSTPKADLQIPDRDIEYAGFWIRTGAAVIDSILVMLITLPILYMLYGPAVFNSTQFVNGPAEVLISYVFPILATILFWIYRSATPGKILLNVKIVRAEDGGAPTGGQYILRYIGYFISMIPLFIGFFWVGFDKRKQGWHDKIAKTVVIIDK